VKVKKFDGYWKKGYPKVDSLTWKPVVDNNTRAAIMQTGEADFAFPMPFEQAEQLKKNPKIDVIRRAVDHHPLPVDEHASRSRSTTSRCVRRSTTRSTRKRWPRSPSPAYAVPAEGVVPAGVEYARSSALAYDPAKAAQLLKEAGYPNGFETTLWSAYNHTTRRRSSSSLQQQLGQVGIKVQRAGAGSRPARRAGAERSRTRIPPGAHVLHRLVVVDRRSRLGAASAARFRGLPAEAAEHRLLQATRLVDANIAKALNTTDAAEKSKLYKAAQKQIWKTPLGLPGDRASCCTHQQEPLRHLRHARIVQLSISM
jgi:glutathione transport system substrate-binding protein